MDMHQTLLTLGVLFAIGLIADEIGRRTLLPRVTALMMIGVAAGPAGFDLIPPDVSAWSEFLAAVALTMVAFLLGGSLSVAKLKANGRYILTMSVAVVITSLAVVGGGLMIVGVAPAIAILLAGIATATDPAATLDVLKQTGARGTFAETLEGVVAIDDLWGLIAFSLMLILAKMTVGDGIAGALQHGLWELFGAIAVGAVVGIPAAYLTGRLKPGEPMQVEALAVVFLCAGVAIWLEVSFLLAGVVAGMIVVNFAEHHTRAFHEIEHIEWPFMVLFFVLAGASLQADQWRGFAWLAGAYLVLRAISRIAGGWIGGSIGPAPASHRWMGAALMPQAGVAVGMALVAGDHFPDLREAILTVTIATTVIFEILGPVVARVALLRATQLDEMRE